MAARRHGHGKGAGAVGHVEHRGGVQPVGPAIDAKDRRDVEGIHDQIGLAHHHTLGDAGGAAGIKQPRQIVAPAARIRDRGLALDQAFIIVQAVWCRVITQIDHLAHARHFSVQGFEHGHECIVDKEEFAAGIV